MYNLIAHWNEQAHKIAGMPLDFNEERERAMFEEEYQEFFNATTPAEKLDALADMQFLIHWIGYKDKQRDSQMVAWWQNILADCLETMKSDNIMNNILDEQQIAYLKEMIIDIALAEVIKANYTRFWEWCYIREDGKFMKSPNYTKPDLQWIVDTYWVTFS